MKKTFLTIFIAGVLAGCGTTPAETGLKSDSAPVLEKALKEKNLSQIQKGITSKEDLSRLFGSPTTDLPTSENKICLEWSYPKLRIMGDGSIETTTLTAILEPNGRVGSHKLKQESRPLPKWTNAGAIVLGGQAFDERNISKIEMGVTTRETLIHHFGTPASDEELGDGYSGLSWAYRTNGYLGNIVQITTLKVMTGKDGKIQGYQLNKGFWLR